YLRAPDVFFTLLEKGHEKLSPIGKQFEVKTYLILPKKADQVIVLETDQVPTQLADFFKPFIRSPRYFAKPNVQSTPHTILICTATEAKQNAALKKFLKDAAYRLKSDFDAEPERDDWFVVDQTPQTILWQRRHAERHMIFFNPLKFHSYDFYRLVPLRYDDTLAASFLMSTMTWFFKELLGRTN